MDVIFRYLHFLYVVLILLGYLPEKISTPLAQIILREQILPILWTPYQVIFGVIYRMTGPSKWHAAIVSRNRLGGIGGLPAPL